MRSLSLACLLTSLLFCSVPSVFADPINIPLTDDPTITASPGPGQGLANFYHLQPGDTYTTTITPVTAPNGNVAAIVTWNITLAASTPNTYRDPNTGQVIQIDPNSIIVADPAGAPVIPGKATFRICIPINVNTPQVTAHGTEYIRPPAGAIVNIGGVITSDAQMPANPQGVFQNIETYLASLNPPTINIGQSDLPQTFFFYPLSFDSSPIAQTLTETILTSEGIADFSDYTVSVTAFSNDTGQTSVLYSFGTTIPEPSTFALFGAGILALGWWRRAHRALAD